MNRRNFLSVLGGGTVLAATAGGAWLATRTPARALEPWNLAGTYGDPRRDALSWGLLAPNPHNRQPWLVDLAEPDAVTLYAQGDRDLPHTDPFDRQLTIGLGCFVALTRMAAGEAGQRVDVEPFPEGWSAEGLDARPVARMRFVKGEAEPDPLFAHALARRSNKEPFDMARAVAGDDLAAIVAASPLAGGTVDAADVGEWRRITEDALRVETETPRTYKESVDLFRIGKGEVERNPDGIDFSGPFFDAAGATGLFSREAALDRSGSAYEQGLDAVMENARTAMGFVWLATADNDRPTQLAAARTGFAPTSLRPGGVWAFSRSARPCRNTRR